MMGRRVFQVCEDFKKEFKPILSRDAVVTIDNRISRTVLTSWTIDILLLLSTQGSVRFEEIRKKLPGVSGKVLSRKLSFLEGKRLVTRKVTGSKPPRVEYKLSPEGLVVAQLGESLMLYLRHIDGSR